MEYNEARIQALETEVFNLKQENNRLKEELEYFKRRSLRGDINNAW